MHTRDHVTQITGNESKYDKKSFYKYQSVHIVTFTFCAIQVHLLTYLLTIYWLARRIVESLVEHRAWLEEDTGGRSTCDDDW